ncbi:MAG TPA: hypothetical protein PKW15_01740, partial [Alphaproteobacteria bacterium]|nr:hypothetical protein [Alphaproteobacteria bacterium]
MMQNAPKTLWQIAYPQQVGTHEHMGGPKAFIEAMTAYCRRQGDVVLHFPWARVPDTQKAITLNFHTYGYRPLEYHYKESYLDGWVQMDTLGYSGWHSSNFFKGELNRYLMPFMEARRARMPDKIAKYIASKKSKYVQADADVNIEGNYLFFPLQRPQDETGIFARYTTEEIIAAALPWCRANNYKLVIKQHPYCTSWRTADWIKTLTDDPHLIVTTGDVVKIFSKAKAVLTISSSVGFEALLRDVPVFCFGASEYGYLTHEVFDLNNLGEMLTEILLSGKEKQSSLPGVYDFAAAHLYDTADEADIADLYQAIKSYSLKTGTHLGWMPGELPPEIDFREGYNGENYLLHGFSTLDNPGVPSNQSRASLAFEHHGEMEIKTLSIAYT